MGKLLLSVASALVLTAGSALAAQPKDDKPEKPITQKEPSAMDVAATPATDLNIKKNEIPELLLAAEQRPYVLRGFDTCRQIAAEIGRFDAVLGDDIDVPQAEGKRTSPGRVAQSVVGSLIPFRGLIREISGANQQDRALQSAIIAGVARRSFLKGIGQAKGCRYPARSATLDVYNYRMAAIEKGEEPWRAGEADAEPQAQRERGNGRDASRAVRYVSRPQVQRAD